MSSSTATAIAGEGAAAAKSSSRQPRAPRPRSGKKKNWVPFWLLSPAGILILVLTLAPIAFLVYTSFTDYDQRSLFTGEYSTVGIGQYINIFTDPDFWASVVRTILFTAAMVIGTIVIGLAVSQLLVKLNTGMRYVVTVALIFAWAMPNVATSMVWNWLFQPGYGVINWILTKLQIFGDMTNTAWDNTPFLAFTCIWLLVVWQAVPFIALTLYAAQTQVSQDYFEAARLDGASEFYIYFKITVHFLKPTLLLVTILSIIWDFNVFNQIWLVSGGGPNNATATLGVWTYKVAFGSFDIGQGAAISVVSTALLMIISGFYIRSLLRSGEDL